MAAPSESDKVDRCPRFAFIHGHDKPVTANTELAAESLSQCVAKADCCVLDRVVIIDVEISFAREFQTEAAVLRNLLQHVIVETNAGMDSDRLRTVQIHAYLDVSLICPPANGRCPLRITQQVNNAWPCRRTFACEIKQDAAHPQPLSQGLGGQGPMTAELSMSISVSARYRVSNPVRGLRHSH